MGPQESRGGVSSFAAGLRELVDLVDGQGGVDLHGTTRLQAGDVLLDFAEEHSQLDFEDVVGVDLEQILEFGDGSAEIVADEDVLGHRLDESVLEGLDVSLEHGDSWVFGDLLLSLGLSGLCADSGEAIRVVGDLNVSEDRTHLSEAPNGDLRLLVVLAERSGGID